MKRFCACLLVFTCSPLTAQETKVPAWNARGVGPLPRMGITSIDVSDDGKEIAVGTIAAFGDPNVIILSDAGKIVRTYKVGQQWIDNVAFVAGTHDVIALCTMPAGKAGDRTEAFLVKADDRKSKGEDWRLRGSDHVIPLKLQQNTPWFFHYGNHSNHPTMKLARAKNATALLAGDQLVVYRKDKAPTTLRVPVKDPDASVSLAVDEHGWTIVGTTTHEASLPRKGGEEPPNLFLFDPDKQKPVWTRAANKDVEKAPPLEKGLYGTPTLPNGKRDELPQRDEKVWAPLSVAIHSDGAKKLIAVADYQGWQRWVRSSATMKDDNQGLRFVPTKPTITVYDEGKQVDRRGFTIGAFEYFADMKFSSSGKHVYAYPRHWKSRGLGAQAILPDDAVHRISCITIGAKFTRFVDFGGSAPVFDVAMTRNDKAIVATWPSEGLQVISPGDDTDKLPGEFDIGGPSLLRLQPGGAKMFIAKTDGVLAAFDAKGRKLWQTDLNKSIPKSPKPWLANARATPIVPGVWQIPGGRVESDLGGQRLIEGPDGYILIEGHAGLSFEREWASMVAVGLDPMKVKYVLATHEHGDHAPGAYLWRVVTGAKFVCSEEMAYTLQHHIPGNTGYGLHPPVPTDIVIKKDTELDLAGLKIKAIRIPGHTAGSMAWHFEMPSRERKRPVSFVAFGDLIMPKGVLGYSGSVNFSATDALASLRKLHDLKVDYVLPGHGAVEGPANYFQAGIDVGSKVGWGFIKPERPDPRFRITKDNVIVVGWGQGAVSAACGDVNGDGKPDVVLVCPDGDGSIVKFFLNHGGKFNDQPDHEIKVPVSQPHKLRIAMTKGVKPHVLVAGKTAALLVPQEKFPEFKVMPFEFGDGNHLRFMDNGAPLVSRRFGGFYALDMKAEKPTPKKFVPEIDGPYVDFEMIGRDLLTSYGQYYRRGADGKFAKTPALQLAHEKDWTFLAVGHFRGTGKPDVALLSYGMDKSTTMRVFHHRFKEPWFAEKADAIIPLSSLLASAKKNQNHPLVRDTPVVADWNGDGIDDLIVAHGQHDEVLILLGGKDGLSKDRVQRIQLEYRVHYEHGVFVGDFNGDGKKDLAVFGYTNTGVGASGPPAVYVWLQ